MIVTGSYLIWASATVFFLLFAIYSIKEKEKRAAILASLFALLSGLVLLAQILLHSPAITYLQWGTVVLFLGFVILSVTPWRNNLELKIFPSEERFDERDVMFARGEYKPGTKKYEEYYGKLHPEKKEFDDKLHQLPDVCEGGSLYEPLNSKLCGAEFSFITNLLTAVDGEVAPEKIEVEPKAMTERIKGITKYLGADLVGIAPVEKRYFYSHVGRGPEEWGKEIEVKHKYAISFAVEMDYDMVSSAPFNPTAIESGKQYVRMAMISVILANYIRSLGYSARAHISESNYQAILPPFAYLAGLGELGRMGYIITKEFGPRVRLGLVTTNLPLVPDKPVKFGVQDFCTFCKKCADNCPSRAIPFGEKQVIRGVEKWQLDYEKCYLFWRKIGTDCALCMYTCPYGKATNFFHGLVRKYSTLSHFARRVCKLGDDLFYGKKPRKKVYPGWMKTNSKKSSEKG